MSMIYCVLNVGVCTRIRVCKWWEWWITWLFCPIFILSSEKQVISILQSLYICLQVLSLLLPVILLNRPLSHQNFFFSHFMSACIFLCRCFDRQGYCSRGWCLDTGWHCTVPWAHAQIREDIRNPSLHVSFNHTGWRGNVFMDLILERIHRVFECEFVCNFVDMLVF